MPLPKRTPPVRTSPTGKRKRPFSGDDEEEAVNEFSDSELSDIEDEETPIAPDEDEDDEDEDEEDVEEEEEEEEDSSDSDSLEGENEEPYTFEGEQDVSDEDSDMKMKQPVRNVAQRAIASRVGVRRTAKRPAPTRKPVATSVKKVGKFEEIKKEISPQKLRNLPARITQPRSSSATRSSFSATNTQGTASKKQSPKSTPMIKLKIAAATTQSTAARTPKTTAIASASAASAAAVTTVAGRKVVQDDSDSDEDDEVESKMDEDDEPEDELGDEDAEGETDEEIVDSEDEINNNTPGTDFMSRTGTPDKSRLTNRQRTRLGDITTADLLELPSGYEKPGSNKAVTLSAQEQELKRAEMARRRKNLTDQKLEEEKIDTINRLLKKQTPKMRGRGKVAGDATPADQANAEAVLEGVDLPFPPTMVRWVSNKDGIRLSIPDRWLKARVGRIFEPQRGTETMRTVRRKLIEEL